MRRRSSQLRDARILLRVGIVDRTVIDQTLAGNLDDDLAVPQATIHPIIRDAADRRGVELPFPRDRLDFLDPIRLGDDEHPLLRLRKQNLVRRHARFAFRHFRQINFDPAAGAACRFARRTGKTRCAHVLNSCNRATGKKLKARF